MTFHHPLRSLIPLLALVTVLLAASSQGAHAHAELVRSDPPADGLVVSAPASLTLEFSEEVVLDNPAPLVRLLDQQGQVVGADPLQLASSDDPRTLVVELPDLDRGTYTMDWQVTSATDGHALSGTFAFRVGGGLPPGLATSEDALPAAWAVVTRWLTFLGASLAAGLCLFGLVTGASGESTAWQRRRTRGMLAGAAVALAATLTEPLLQWATGNSKTSFLAIVRGLPDGWWWRPLALGPLVALATVVVVRKALLRPVAVAGALLALASLLGLVMTSHAAGRADYRWLAVASDAVHQWSVALWVGGLAALVMWLAARDATVEADYPLARFSRVALALVAVSIVTGVVNTGLVYPVVDQVRAKGWTIDAIEPLLSSNYGIVLIAKVLVLLVPLALAARHRAIAARITGAAERLTSALPRWLARWLRWETALAAFVVAGGATLALSAPPQVAEHALERVTLVSSTAQEPGPESMLVHLTLDSARAGENTFEIRLTDWTGAPLAADPAPRVTLDLTSLDHGTRTGGIALNPVDGEAASYRATGLSLSLDGWWQVDARVQPSGQPPQVATFYTLLPDPNTQGFNEPPRPDSDPEAQALFETALGQMQSWRSVRWTEDLGSGSDVLVRANFAVIDGGDPASSAQSLDVAYSASFGQPGRPPPLVDSRSSITVGERGWLRISGGTWLEQPPTSYAVPSEWGETYAGATNHRMGTQVEIDGRELQAVTFYLPERTSRAEAWLVWWIDPATGDVAQVAMIARMHYMVWSYSDINGDFTIEPPAGQ